MEIVTVIVMAEGNYEINVKPLEAKTGDGNFTLTLKERKQAIQLERIATEQD